MEENCIGWDVIQNIVDNIELSQVIWIVLSCIGQLCLELKNEIEFHSFESILRNSIQRTYLLKKVLWTNLPNAFVNAQLSAFAHPIRLKLIKSIERWREKLNENNIEILWLTCYGKRFTGHCEYRSRGCLQLLVIQNNLIFAIAAQNIDILIESFGRCHWNQANKRNGLVSE